MNHSEMRLTASSGRLWLVLATALVALTALGSGCVQRHPIPPLGTDAKEEVADVTSLPDDGPELPDGLPGDPLPGECEDDADCLSELPEHEGGPNPPECDALDCAPAPDETVQADSCDGITCSDHGKCALLDGAPICLCDPGFAPLGLECIDPCEGVDCTQYGHCELAGGLPVCICTPPYVSVLGPGCALDICAEQSCSGHGTCVNLGGVAACACNEGFTAVGLACVSSPLLDEDKQPTCAGSGEEGEEFCLSSEPVYDAEEGPAPDFALPEDALPGIVDHKAEYLDTFCSLTSNQGGCGWCAAHAVTQAMEALFCAQGNEQDPVSEPHLWWVGGKDTADCEGGWYVSVALATAQKAYLVPDKVWPYDGTNGKPTKFAASDIGTAVLTEKGAYRVTESVGVSAASVTSLKAALAAGYNVVYSVPVFWYAGWSRYNQFWAAGDIDLAAPSAAIPLCTTGTTWDKLGSCRCDTDANCPGGRWCYGGRCADGFHAILITGYDDSGNGWFQFRNSWGGSWGDNGFGRLSYQYISGFGRGGTYPKALQQKCNTHDFFQCWNGAIHWFDSCGQVEDQKESCENGCAPGSAVCTPCQCKSVSACCPDGCHFAPANTSCGDCLQCNASGQCNTPKTNGIACGNKPGAWKCASGTCSCTPACTGKVCGPDNCGSICGTCPTDYLCMSGGAECKADCPAICSKLDCGLGGQKLECDCTKLNGACNDGLDCTHDSCEGNTCIFAPDHSLCEDVNDCTFNYCDPAQGCVFPANDEKFCNDLDSCTIWDSCNKGVCAGVPLDCDDGNPCTDDSCNAADGQCLNVPNTAPCTDDGNPCTADVCAAAACTHPAGNDGTECDDANLCTVDSACAAGKCKGGKATPADDGNPCTLDDCDPLTGVQHFPYPDATPCALQGICKGFCTAGDCLDTAVEVCDGKDNDCDTDVDEDFPNCDWDGLADCVDDDDDDDGVPDADDCMPCDPTIFPGQKEDCGNGIDDDCDWLVDYWDTKDCESNPDLLFYLPLDSQSGGVFLDASGNGHDGTTVNGVSTIAGKANGAAWFDGKDDFVKLPDPNDLKQGKTRTVSLWFKADKSWRKRVAFSQEDYRDLNGDGWLDVAVAQSSSVRLFSGTETGPAAMGWLDLEAKGATGLAAGDMNGDGYLDLVVANSYDSQAKTGKTNSYVYWGSGTGFTGQNKALFGTVYGSGLSVADLNGDANLDVVVAFQGDEAGAPPTSSRVFLGPVAGFANPANQILLPTSGAYGTFAADANSDGFLDVAFANSRLDKDHHNIDSVVYWGTATGPKTAAALGLPTMGGGACAVADLNADGYPDIVFANIFDQVAASTEIESTIFWGGSNGFNKANLTGLPTSGSEYVSVADLNGDGYLDIVFPNYEDDAGLHEIDSYVYWGSALGYSAQARAALPTHGANGSAVADLDGDGFLDIVFSSRSYLGASDTDSFVYWGGEDGFDVLNRSGLPTYAAASVCVPGGPLAAASTTLGSQPSDYGNFQMYTKDGNVVFKLFDFHGKPYEVSAPYTANQWTHVVAGYDATAKKLVLWVNGKLAVEKQAPIAMGETFPWRIRVGSDCENQDKFAGGIDEVNVFDKLLTQEEVTNLYGAPGCPNGCQGKQCGFDACGNSCGKCGSGYECVDNQCEWKPITCDGVACPDLPGYQVVCNPQKKCEYGIPNATGWKAFDVWLYVPPGEFLMGSSANEQGHGVDEEPLHKVTIPNGYFVAKYETTVAQYEACQAAGKCTAPSVSNWDGDGWGVNRSKNSNAPAPERPTHPQNGIDWQQAKDVCAWQGGRLPTEAEWEYAATGPTHRKYPWGDALEPNCSNNTAVYDADGDGMKPWGCDACTTKGCSGTSPVGTEPAGVAWSGALDMAGNVWEWCEDWYHDSYYGAPADGKAWRDPAGTHRVVHGGGFSSVAASTRSANRGSTSPFEHGASHGVRCVRPVALSCGNAQCPEQPGYKVYCNPQQHCEYANADPTGWKKWDVWILVPPGKFMMGSPEDEDGRGPDEGPIHEVTFKEGYLVAKYEIVTEQYAACQKAGKCAAPAVNDWEGHGWGINSLDNGRFDHPQNGVSHPGASQFCAWVSPGGRLPTEAEWEYAASGPVHRKYPWGDTPEPSCDNNTAVYGTGKGKPWACNPCLAEGCSGTVPVSSMTGGAAWSGALQMSGNVWEWTKDWYHDSYAMADGASAPSDGSAWMEPIGPEPAVRGGSFAYAASDMRSSARTALNVGGGNANTGARCVRPIVAPFNCNGTVCPEMPGYDVTCNVQGMCEYANPDKTGWKKHDVWIYVPPGSFQMGSPDAEEGHEPDESPVHAVTIKTGYMIAKYEMTVAQYEGCIADKDCSDGSVADWDTPGKWGLNTSVKGRGEHPQNGIRWDQAKDACAWIAPGGRLPSEAEWEYAATGPMHRTYPWGEVPGPTCPNDVAVFNGGIPGCGTGGTMAVGSKSSGASWAGALDMAGNVWEWCDDGYHATYSGAPVDGGVWLQDGTDPQRVSRGGSFYHSASSLRTARRTPAPFFSKHVLYGARCVRPAPASECGGVKCPKLDGYIASCNRQDKCEYHNLDTTGHKRWDVWIYVPAGTFKMGSPPNEGGHQADEEDPSQLDKLHPVTFAKGYFIGKYEVVVEQYEACQKENGEKCTAPDTTDWPGTQGTNTNGGGKGEHPQNGLTWQQAKGFCGWVAPNGHLPSEAEWEYAAKGPVHRKYPWGDGPDPTCSNNTAVFNETGGAGGYGCSQGGTWKVGSKTAGASWSGALDMAGNLWEWCEDWVHSNYQGAPGDGSAWVDPTGSARVIRGGNFSYGANMRAASRSSTDPGHRWASSGARCVRPAL